MKYVTGDVGFKGINLVLDWLAAGLKQVRNFDKFTFRRSPLTRF